MAQKAGYHPRGNYAPGGKKASGKTTLKEQGFYHTPAWRKARKLALQRDHYLCQLRISPRCSRVATEVHHILELEDHPEKALDLNNLTSCCWWCHEETKRRGAARSARQAGVRVIKITDNDDTDQR
mgnify:CR=1 FL=1